MLKRLAIRRSHLTFNLYWTQNISQNCSESRLFSPWWLAFCDCTLSPRLLSWDKSSEKISLVHPTSLHLVQNMVALDLDFTVVPTSEASAAAGRPGNEETPVRGGATGSCSELKQDAEIVCTEDINTAGRSTLGLECWGDPPWPEGSQVK